MAGADKTATGRTTSGRTTAGMTSAGMTSAGRATAGRSAPDRTAGDSRAIAGRAASDKTAAAKTAGATAAAFKTTGTTAAGVTTAPDWPAAGAAKAGRRDAVPPVAETGLPAPAGPARRRAAAVVRAAVAISWAIGLAGLPAAAAPAGLATGISGARLPLLPAQSGYSPPPAIYAPYVPPRAGIGLPPSPGYGARNPPATSGAPKPPQPGTPGWEIPAPDGSLSVVLPPVRPPCVVSPTIPGGCPGSPQPVARKPAVEPKPPAATPAQ